MPKYQLLVCDIAGTILKDNNEVASSFRSVFEAVSYTHLRAHET